MIARKDIDAVMIATPDHWHMVMAIAAFKAGKDVACEKPLTRNIASGRKVADPAEEAGVPHGQRIPAIAVSPRRPARPQRQARQAPAHHHRHAQGFDLPPQPDMPVPPELNYDMWLGPAPQRLTRRSACTRATRTRAARVDCIRDYADGMLANWGAHLNDIAMWANDTEHTGPIEIEAKGKYPPAGNLWDIIQEFEAHFLFANGVRLTCKTDKP